MSVISFSEELRQQAINGSYKVKCEVLERRVLELEKRVEQLELALELYRKDSQRES
ncbi:MAG TPA: hypothetical protein PKW79_00365 [Rhabdochlamydiaceae bacterium]|nr:hypothetical protein [Rhabdochlamydiaceae bacterium]